MPSTAIAENLDRLVSEIGVENLRSLPLQHVDALEQHEDEKAVPIKIFFGHMRETSNSTTRHEVFAYLIPASSSNKFPETSFRFRQSDGECIGISSANIRSAVKNLSEAFRGPTMTRDKVIALSKYYFLTKMVAHQVPDKVLPHGVPLASRFVDALKQCCREYAEVKEKSAASATRLRTRGVARVTKRPSSSRTPVLEGILQEPECITRVRSSCKANEGVAGMETVEDDDEDFAKYVLASSNSSGHETTKESPASQSSQLSDAASELPKATKGDISAERAERIERFNSLKKRQVAVTGKVNSTLKRREKLKKAIARLELEEHELAQQQLQISSKKRQLLQSMSVDDQLEFVYEAGRTAESKRLRNGQ